MTDFIHPPGIHPTQVTWSLVRNQQRATSPYSGTVQRNDRGGDLWRCRLEYPDLSPENSGILMGWLDRVSRGGNAALVPVFQNRTGVRSRARSLQAAVHANLITPFYRDTPPFGFTNIGSMFPLYSLDFDLAARANTGAAGAGSARTFTGLAAVPYLLTVDVPDQYQNPGHIVNDSSNATILNRNNTRLSGRIQDVITVPADGQITLVLYPAGGNLAFERSRWTAIELQRAYVTQAAATAGQTALRVTGHVNELGGNNIPVFAAGQFVNVQTSRGMELKRLTSEAEMLGGGSLNGVGVLHFGRLEFEPALRGAVASNAVVQHINPVCRMLLSEAVSNAVTTAPLRSGFAIEMIEAPQ